MQINAEVATVAEAVTESVTRNCIVRVASTPKTRAELLDICEDNVESDELEFWGTTEAGDNWRVHCASPGNWNA